MPPGPPFTIVALGSASGHIPGTGTLTIAGVNCNAGDTIVVAACVNGTAPNPNQGMNGLFIDGTPFPGPDGGSNFNVVGNPASSLELWFAPDQPARTNASIVFDFTDTYDAVILASRIAALSVSPLDRSTSVAGSGTSPDSGFSATTQQANEVLYGVVAISSAPTDAPGTWNYGFVANQRAGFSTGPTLADAATSVAVQNNYRAGKSGITSAPWAATVVSLRLR